MDDAREERKQRWSRFLVDMRTLSEEIERALEAEDPEEYLGFPDDADRVYFVKQLCELMGELHELIHRLGGPRSDEDKAHLRELEQWLMEKEQWLMEEEQQRLITIASMRWSGEHDEA